MTAAQARRVMTAHHGVCHVCGHDGSTQVDHIINIATWLRQSMPGSPDQPSNLAPIHGTPDGRSGACPTCGKRCHFDKTQAEAAAGRTPRTRTPEPHPGVIDR